MLDAIVEDVASTLGIPLVVRRAVREHGGALLVDLPAAPAVIAADSVVTWEELAGGGCSGHVLPAAARGLTVTDVLDWTCDIRQVEGLRASKAPLDAYATLDEFAQSSCTAELAEGLDACLRHCTARIVSEDRYPMSVAQWDGRIFLENPDGSHHFAAARYLARQEARSIDLPARVRRTFLDSSAVARLREQHDVFAVRGDAALWIWAALDGFGVRVEQVNAPRQLGEDTVLWLLARDARGQKAAALLRSAGAVDVGRHLAELARRAIPLEAARSVA